MPSLIADVLRDTAEISNEILGESCVYDGYQTPINIIIDKNMKVFNEMGVLAGFRSEANILLSDLTPKVHDTFTDSSGQKWRINMITKQTTAKTYVDIHEVD